MPSSLQFWRRPARWLLRYAIFRFVSSAHNAPVALVCGGTESVADLLHRLNAALGKAAAEDIVIDEVLPEITRRR